MIGRRKFVIGAGALFAGSAAAVGTGAFTSMHTDSRTVGIQKKGDMEGFVGLGPAGFSDHTMSDYPNHRYIRTNGDGDIVFDFDGNGAKGFNEHSVYYVDQALEIHLANAAQLPSHDGDQVYDVILDSNLNQAMMPYTGTTDGDDRRFHTPDGNRKIGWNVGTLKAGESLYIGFKIDTDATGSENFHLGNIGVNVQARQ